MGAWTSIIQINNGDWRDDFPTFALTWEAWPNWQVWLIALPDQTGLSVRLAQCAAWLTCRETGIFRGSWMTPRMCWTSWWNSQTSCLGWTSESLHQAPTSWISLGELVSSGFYFLHTAVSGVLVLLSRSPDSHLLCLPKSDSLPNLTCTQFLGVESKKIICSWK